MADSAHCQDDSKDGDGDQHNVSTDQSEDSDTIHVRLLPFHEHPADPSTAPPGPGSAIPAKDIKSIESFPRSYVDSHPEEIFHHCGWGWWRRGKPPLGSYHNNWRGPGDKASRCHSQKLASSQSSLTGRGGKTKKSRKQKRAEKEKANIAQALLDDGQDLPLIPQQDEERMAACAECETKREAAMRKDSDAVPKVTATSPPTNIAASGLCTQVLSKPMSPHLTLPSSPKAPVLMPPTQVVNVVTTIEATQGEAGSGHNQGRTQIEQASTERQLVKTTLMPSSVGYTEADTPAEQAKDIGKHTTEVSSDHMPNEQHTNRLLLARAVFADERSSGDPTRHEVSDHCQPILEQQSDPHRSAQPVLVTTGSSHTPAAGCSESSSQSRTHVSPSILEHVQVLNTTTSSTVPSTNKFGHSYYGMQPQTKLPLRAPSAFHAAQSQREYAMRSALHTPTIQSGTSTQHACSPRPGWSLPHGLPGTTQPSVLPSGVTPLQHYPESFRSFPETMHGLSNQSNHMTRPSSSTPIEWRKRTSISDDLTTSMEAESRERKRTKIMLQLEKVKLEEVRLEKSRLQRELQELEHDE